MRIVGEPTKRSRSARRSVSTSRTRTWSGSSPSSVIAARSSSSACGCDGQPSQNSSSTCGCVIFRRLGEGHGGPSAERRGRSRGGAPRRPGHEHLFVRSPLYSDRSVPTEIAPTMENMLSSHPDLDAIYSISDTQTFGAVKAIEATGKDPLVVSFDAQPEALKDIQAGTVIDASVGQFPFKVGALAVKTAVEAAQGKTVPKQVISPLIMVDKSNVGDFTADQRKLP